MMSRCPGRFPGPPGGPPEGGRGPYSVEGAVVGGDVQLREAPWAPRWGSRPRTPKPASVQADADVDHRPQRSGLTAAGALHLGRKRRTVTPTSCPW